MRHDPGVELVAECLGEQIMIALGQPRTPLVHALRGTLSAMGSIYSCTKKGGPREPPFRSPRHGHSYMAVTCPLNE